MKSSQRCLVSRIEFLAVLVSLCVVVSGGCSKPKPLVTDCPKSASPETADDAVREVLTGLQQQKIEELWHFLPIAFGEDIQQLVTEFAGRLDEKSWEPFVATCQKARTVVSKIVRDFDEADPSLSDSDRELVKQLRAVEKLLSVLCESELRSVPTMRALNVESYLTGTGNSLVAALSQGALFDAVLVNITFEQFGHVKVELVESVEDSAVVSVQWPGLEPTTHKFVRTRGSRWFPQTIVEAWPIEFPKVREQSLAWADGLRSNPEPWHARLREIDGLLDELAKTKSLAETRAVWQTGVSHLAVEWFGAIPVESPKVKEIPAESPSTAKPARVKRPDTEVLLPDEPQK